MIVPSHTFYCSFALDVIRNSQLGDSFCHWGSYMHRKEHKQKLVIARDAALRLSTVDC